MTTINDQPQHLLARYADRTGCHYTLSKPGKPEWHAPRYPSAQIYHRLDWTIRLALSKYGLPSHLKPYKDNPRLPGDGYRVPTGKETKSRPYEYWCGEWKAGTDNRHEFHFSSYLHMDNRLPASVLPPDWDEMTRDASADAPADTSPHPEIFEAHGQEWYRHTPGDPMPCGVNLRVRVLLGHGKETLRKPGPANTFYWHNRAPKDTQIIGWRPADAPAKLPRPGPQPQDEVQALKARVQELEGNLDEAADLLSRQGEAINSLDLQLAIASTPTLRPIAEMPAEVPEGCVRVFGWHYESRWEWLLSSGAKMRPDAYFLDIRLPAPLDPDEELRREFEAWWGSLQTKPPGKNELFIAFKAGRCAHPQGAAA